MPVKNDREYRTVVEFKAEDDENYIISGYATTFETYEIWEDNDGFKILERIDRNALTETKMDDVILQFDHAGRVFARTSNNTLKLEVDDHGLKIRADLSKTPQARDIYQDIKAEMITKMSFAFSVARDHYEGDEHTSLRVIDAIKKIYDVSVVSIPANQTTEVGVSMRALIDGVIERVKAERLEAEKRARRKQMLELRTRL